MGVVMRFILVLSIVLALVSSCANPLAASCLKESKDFIAAISPLHQKWEDATKLAGSTPRAALASQINTLQEIRREVQAVDVPECSQVVKDNLVASMDSGIDAYLAFLGQKKDYEVAYQFELASHQLELFTKNLKHLTADESFEPVFTSFGPVTEAEKTYENEKYVVMVAFPDDAPTFIQVHYFDFPDSKPIEEVFTTFIQQALPDWTEGKTWLESSVSTVQNTGLSKTIIVGNRLITIRHDEGTDSIILRTQLL
jgi:hypothetical protein